MCHDHRTIKHFVGSSQKVHKNMLWKEKMQMNCQKLEKNQMWRCQEAVILQRCHNPVLQPTCSAQMVKGVQCSETRKLRIRLKSQDRAKKYPRTNLWTNEMRVTLDRGHGWWLFHFKSGSKVEVRYWCGLVLLKMRRSASFKKTVNFILANAPSQALKMKE